MNITLCGSIAFIEQMTALQAKLEAMGHTVQMPPQSITTADGLEMPVLDYYAIRKAASADEQWVWEAKAKAMRSHFAKVEWADAILVVNEDKNNIPGYIGANTLLEAGLAFHLGKKIYLLHAVPKQSFTEELLGMGVQVLHGDLGRIGG